MGRRMKRGKSRECVLGCAALGVWDLGWGEGVFHTQNLEMRFGMAKSSVHHQSHGNLGVCCPLRAV